MYVLDLFLAVHFAPHITAEMEYACDIQCKKIVNQIDICCLFLKINTDVNDLYQVFSLHRLLFSLAF